VSGRPTAAAAGKFDVGGDVSVNPGHVEESVAAASVELVAGEAGDPPGRMPPGVNELMTTAETVNGIVRFQANDLPVVSLYCRVDPGESQREARARVHSLLDQIRPLPRDRDVNHRHRLSVRADIKPIEDAMGSKRWPPGTIAIFSCSGRDLCEEIPLPRRVREQVLVDATPLARPMLAVLGEPGIGSDLGADTATSVEDRIQNRVDEQTKRHFRRVAGVLRTDGYDVLVVGGHEHELPEGSCV
jgi:hypothetical protein